MKRAIIVLRIAIAFSFVYAAVSGYLDPTAWIGFFPAFLRHLAPTNVVVGGWGAFETLVAIVLLFKKDVFYVSLLAAALLLGITVFNWGAMDIVFRDVSIGLAAIALALLSRENKSFVGADSAFNR